MDFKNLVLTHRGKTILAEDAIQNSVTYNATDKKLELVNDSQSPGNNKYYGTDGSGTKGFFALPTDANTLGGVSASNYARTDIANTFSATQTIQRTNNYAKLEIDSPTQGYYSTFSIKGNSNGTNGIVGAMNFINDGDSIAGIYGKRAGADDAGELIFLTQATGAGNLEKMKLSSTGVLTVGGNEVLTTASTIDADTLDSLDSTQFLRSDIVDYMTSGSGISGTGTGASNSCYLRFNDSGNIRKGYVGFFSASNTRFYVTNAETNGDLYLGTDGTGKVLVNGDEILTIASSLSADKLTGTISIDRLPPSALERLVPVANETARFALTTTTVQLGDTVKENDTEKLFIVIDEANLGNSAGYEQYTVGAASSVPWSGVTSKPSPTITLSGDAVGSVTLTELANGTLNITQINADTFDGVNSTNFARTDVDETFNGNVTVIDNVYMKRNSGITGSGTGTANMSYFSFFESDNTTLQGAIGFGSPSSNTLDIDNKITNGDIDLKTLGTGKATVNGDEILTETNLDDTIRNLLNASGVKGSSTGTNNLSYFEFNESNGTTRQGFVGMGSTSNNTLYLYNDVAGSDIYLSPGAGGKATVNDNEILTTASTIDADTLGGVASSNYSTNNSRRSDRINLLSDAVALCESADNSTWTKNNVTMVTDSENRLYGKDCIKMTANGANARAYVDITSLVDNTKYYLISANFKNVNLTTGMYTFFVTDDQSIQGTTITSTTYQRTGTVIQPSDFDTATYVNLRVYAQGLSTEYGYVDGLSLIEITASEYAEGATALLAKFPFTYSDGQDSYDEINTLADEEVVVSGRLLSKSKGLSTANLLDDVVAGMESTSGWTTNNVTLTTDSSNALEGTNCLKITDNGASAYIQRDVLSLLDTSKYYMLSAHFKNVDAATGLRLQMDSDDQTIQGSYLDGTYYARTAIVIAPTDFDTATYAYFKINISANTSEYGFADAIMLQEITAEEYNQGASAMLDKYSYHRGLGSAEGVRIKSVGKNLNYGELSNGYLNSTTGLFIANNNYLTNEKYIKIEALEDYTLNNNLSYTFDIVFYTESKKFISRTSKVNDFTTVANCRYIRWNTNTSGQTVVDSEYQLEQSSSATTYESYKESISYTPTVLRSVPNLTQDEFCHNDGRFVKRVEEYTLVSGDITALTVGTNVDYVTVAQPADIVGGLTGGGTYDGVTLIEGYPGKGFTDSTDNENTHSTGSSSIFIVVPKGTYANLAEAQADLAGTKIIYELSTPVTTYYPENIVNGYPNGTIYHEKAVEETLTYSSGITITNTNIPVGSLDYIYKVNSDGSKDKVDPSDCTIASNGLSFTISGANNDEVYKFAYLPSSGGTKGMLSYGYCQTEKDESEGNTQGLKELNNKVNDLRYSMTTIDATTLDGITSSNFARTDIDETFNGNIGIGISPSNEALQIHRSGSSAFAQFTNGNTGTANDNGLYVGVGTSGDGYLGTRSNHDLYVQTNNTNRVVVDTNGNVGIGNVSLENWNGSYTALQLGGNASLFANTSQGPGAGLFINQNTYFDGGWKYISTDEATVYQQASGQHKWLIAPSGTADTSISLIEAMVLDNSGDLTINGDLTVTGTIGGSINADTVDSLHASSFLRSDADDTATGNLQFTNSLQVNKTSGNAFKMSGATDLLGFNPSFGGYIQGVNSGSYLYAGDVAPLFKDSGGTLRTVWHSNNDGSGSGLDADKLGGAYSSESASGGSIVKRDSSGNVFVNSLYFGANDYISYSDTLNQYNFYADGSAGSSAIRAGSLGLGTDPEAGSLLHLKDSGDVKMILEADSDNVGESDNPLIELRQDGGLTVGTIGLSSGNSLALTAPSGYSLSLVGSVVTANSSEVLTVATLDDSTRNLLNASGIKGTSTGINNTSYFEFNESDGTTRQGFVGMGSSGNNALYLYNDVAGGDVLLSPGAGGKATVSGNEILTTASTIDANTLGGVAEAVAATASTIAKRDTSGNLKTNTLMYFGSGNDYIDFNDTSNEYTFKHDGGTDSKIVAGDIISNGSSVLTTASTGINADLLDGLNSTAFGRLGTASTWTAKQTFQGTGEVMIINDTSATGDPYLRFQSGGVNKGYIQAYDNGNMAIGGGSGSTLYFYDGSYRSVYHTGNLGNDVLTKTNTTSFTPSADYHPATKKYVDDNGGGGIASGYNTLSQTVPASSTYTFTIALGITATRGWFSITDNSNGGVAGFCNTSQSSAQNVSVKLNWHSGDSDDIRITNTNNSFTTFASDTCNVSDVWIDGTNLKIKFSNTSGSGQNPAARLTWMAWE